MLIRFIGPAHKQRMLAGYEWSRVAGFVQDVPAALAVVCLLQPGEQFGIDEAEELLSIEGIDVDRAGALTLAGVGSVVDLAGLNAAQQKVVAREVGVSRREVGRWMREAIRRCDEEAYAIAAAGAEQAAEQALPGVEAGTGGDQGAELALSGPGGTLRKRG